MTARDLVTACPIHDALNCGWCDWVNGQGPEARAEVAQLTPRPSPPIQLVASAAEPSAARCYFCGRNAFEDRNGIPQCRTGHR